MKPSTREALTELKEVMEKHRVEIYVDHHYRYSFILIYDKDHELVDQVDKIEPFNFSASTINDILEEE